MYCTKCRTEVNKDINHCPNCGEKIINSDKMNNTSDIQEDSFYSKKECCTISCFSTMLILGINFIAFAIGGKTEDTYTAVLTHIWYAFIFIASFIFTGYIDTKKKNTNFKVNKKSMWISISVTAIVGVLGNCFLLYTIRSALVENKALNKLLIYGFIFIISFSSMFCVRNYLSNYKLIVNLSLTLTC